MSKIPQKDLIPEEFVEKRDLLMNKYEIDRNLAGCHLVNFEDKYICHVVAGGCDNLRKCRLIHMLETDDKYIRPVSSDKLVRCEACSELFLKTSLDGRLIEAFGLCQKCDEYVDDLLAFVMAFESEGKDE